MNGRISVDLGVVPIRLATPELAETYVLELTAARLDGTIDENGLDVVVAGALTQEAIDTDLLPFIIDILQASVALDCTAEGCESGSNGETFLELFDENGDRQVSEEEVRGNSLVQSLLAPDVDLFDDRDLRPRCDGIKESLSVGLGVTAVRARFAGP